MSSLVSSIIALPMQKRMLSPNDARELYDNHVDRHFVQRIFKPGKAKDIEKTIKAGTYMGVVPFVFFKIRGINRLLLVDGQHRMSAIANAGVVVEVFFVVMEMPDEATARKAFLEFYRGSTPSATDAVSPAQMSGAGLTPSETKLVLGAGRIIYRNFNVSASKGKLDPELLSGMFENWSAAGQEALKLIRAAAGNEAKHWEIASVLAVMMPTLLPSSIKVEATRFWENVLNKHARRSMYEQETREARIRHNLTAGGHHTRQAVISGMLAGWNAWRDSLPRPFTGSPRNGAPIYDVDLSRVPAGLLIDAVPYVQPAAALKPVITPFSIAAE